MDKIYEVFEFKAGKSLRNIEGPLTYIKVLGGDDKYRVLGTLDLPGDVYGYGLREVDNLDDEMTARMSDLGRATRLRDTLEELLP